MHFFKLFFLKTKLLYFAQGTHTIEFFCIRINKTIQTEDKVIKLILPAAEV